MVKKGVQSWRYNSPDSVHNSGKYCLLAMFLSVVIVLALDVWLLWLWTEGQSTFFKVFAIHCLASSLFLMQSAMCWWLHRAWGFGLLTFPLVLVLGPVGAVGILLTALVFVFSRESATPFDTWYEEILPEKMTPPEERMIEYLRLWGHEAEVQNRDLIPFTDILVSGSVKEKQSAIDIIVKNYHPLFSAVLRGALKDPVNTIRTHAVAAITRIEEMYQDKALLLEEKMVAHPDDAESILNLAKHFDEHANAGLSDVDTLAGYRLQAEKLYRQFHDLKATNTSVLWLLGRLLIRDERSREALLVFDEALKISGNVAKPQQRIWHWECLYDLRRFSILREQVQMHYEQVLIDPALPKPLLESIALWVRHENKFVALKK